MFDLDGKKFRNIQEQVLKNTQDIEHFREVNSMIAEYGIKVVGHVEDSTDLPDPETYEGSYGDAYAVGEEDPYEFYIFTRPFDGEQYPSWFSIGTFPLAGPQGEQGETGPEGPTGPIGLGWSIGDGTPDATTITRSGDLYYDNLTGYIYKATLSPQAWTRVGQIVGATGSTGPQGPQGPTGPQGPQGPTGPEGPAGKVVNIAGQLSAVGSLPTPSSVDFHTGYLVGANAPYNLYIITGDELDNTSWAWFDCGPFTSGGEYTRIVDDNDSFLSDLEATDTATASTLVMRDASGNFKSAEPIANSDVATKKYVDDNAGGGITLYVYTTQIANNSTLSDIDLSTDKEFNILLSAGFSNATYYNYWFSVSTTSVSTSDSLLLHFKNYGSSFFSEVVTEKVSSAYRILTNNGPNFQTSTYKKLLVEINSAKQISVVEFLVPVAINMDYLLKNRNHSTFNNLGELTNKNNITTSYDFRRSNYDFTIGTNLLNNYNILYFPVSISLQGGNFYKNLIGIEPDGDITSLIPIIGTNNYNARIISPTASPREELRINYGYDTTPPTKEQFFITHKLGAFREERYIVKDSHSILDPVDIIHAPAGNYVINGSGNLTAIENYQYMGLTSKNYNLSTDDLDAGVNVSLSVTETNGAERTNLYIYDGISHRLLFFKEAYATDTSTTYSTSFTCKRGGFTVVAVSSAGHKASFGTPTFNSGDYDNYLLDNASSTTYKGSELMIFGNYNTGSTSITLTIDYDA